MYVCNICCYRMNHIWWGRSSDAASNDAGDLHHCCICWCMSFSQQTYSLGDILRLDQIKTLEFEIMNKDILKCISRTQPAFNGLHSHPTQWGHRAGRRYSRRTKPHGQATAIMTKQPTEQVTSSQTSRSKHQYLPSILYNNCCSLVQGREPTTFIDLVTLNPRI